MNREYKERLSRQIEKNYSDLEMRIMEDIVRRIKKTGEITSTADWQINRLRILGNSSEDIEKMLKETLDASYPEMFELYDKVIDWEYVRNKDIYEQINAEFIPYEENGQLQQITNALIQQTDADLQNITQSLGFYLDYGGGKPVLTPLSEVYQKYLDAACMDIVSGAFDYNSVLRRVVTQLTNSGLRQIDYASGRGNRVDVAARRAVMTGITQLTGKISDMNADKLGTEYFEVAWHAGARPTHAIWQGRVWSKEQLVTVCGLGTVTGLEGANCYHERYPFVPGISERNWSDEWLEKKNREENAPKEFRGKQYTVYEAKQKQRQMETAMRAQREKVQLLQKGGADPDDVMLARARYQGQLNEYSKFSSKMGLKEERERIYIDGRGRVAPYNLKYLKVSDTTDSVRLRYENPPSKPVNKYGQEIIFDDGMSNTKWSETRRILTDLAQEYDTRLTTVKRVTDARKNAGSVGLSGDLEIGSRKPEVAFHEFAHSITQNNLVKYDLGDDADADFWKEIKKIRTKYRKAVSRGEAKSITGYANENVDEFFAEAFAHAKMRELGYENPLGFGKDFTYSQQVLNAVDKYFKKSIFRR